MHVAVMGMRKDILCLKMELLLEDFLQLIKLPINHNFQGNKRRMNMNKFKNWLRIKLKSFLDIGDLESNFKDYETFNSIRFSDIESDAHDKTSYLRKLINNSDKKYFSLPRFY